MPKQRRWLAMGLAILVVAAGACGSGTSGDPTAGEQEFALLDGGTTSISSFQGQPVVLNFFASWCAPCRVEMPELEMVHQQRGEQVTIIGVSVNDTDTRAREIVDETGVTYITGFNPDGSLAEAYGSLGMPTTVFIDADGEVRQRHTGALTAEAVNDLIDEHLIG